MFAARRWRAARVGGSPRAAAARMARRRRSARWCAAAAEARGVARGARRGGRTSPTRSATSRPRSSTIYAGQAPVTADTGQRRAQLRSTRGSADPAQLGGGDATTTASGRRHGRGVPAGAADAIGAGGAGFLDVQAASMAINPFAASGEETNSPVTSIRVASAAPRARRAARSARASRSRARAADRDRHPDHDVVRARRRRRRERDGRQQHATRPGARPSATAATRCCASTTARRRRTRT